MPEEEFEKESIQEAIQVVKEMEERVEKEKKTSTVGKKKDLSKQIIFAVAFFVMFIGIMFAYFMGIEGIPQEAVLIFLIPVLVLLFLRIKRIVDIKRNKNLARRPF